MIEEDLSRSHPSRPHNKLIADVFLQGRFYGKLGAGNTTYY